MRICVIFDMDGVIFDSERVSLRSWIKAGCAMGLPEDRLTRAVFDLIGTNDEETRRRIEVAMSGCVGFDYDLLCAEMWKTFVTESEGGLPVKPGVGRILSDLDEAGIPYGLASSTRRSVVEHELSDAGLLGRFSATVCGDEIERGKPDPDIFLRCCEKLNGKPECTFVIEDSYNGIRAASAAGMQAIMVPDLLKPTSEMNQLACCVCKDLFSARDYIFSQVKEMNA